MYILRKGKKRFQRFDWKSFATYIFLVQLLIRFGFHNSYIVLPDAVVTCSTLLSGVLYFVVLWNDRDPFGELCTHFPYLVIGMISYLMTGASVILILILGMLVLKDMDQEKVLKWYLGIRLLTVLLITAASLAGIIPNQSVDVLKSGTYTLTLQAYGQKHPNQFAQAAGSILIACICLMKRQYIQWKMMAVGAAAIGLYLLSRSRSMILVTGFVFLCRLLLEFRGTGKLTLNIWQKCSWLPHACIILVGVVCPFRMDYATGFLQKCLYRLDALCSMRISISAAVIRSYPLNVFGNVFDFSALRDIYGDYAVDNSYINLLFNFGTIVFLVILYLSYCTMKKMLANGQAIYAVCLLAMLLWGVFENMITLPSVNFTVLFYGMGVGNRFPAQLRFGGRRKKRS